jgi:hypothetical protein
MDRSGGEGHAWDMSMMNFGGINDVLICSCVYVPMINFVFLTVTLSRNYLNMACI